MKQPVPAETQRLDIWLDIACLFKTRSEAQRACRLGKVSVNGTTAKPNREVRAGDELAIARPFGRRQLVVVRDLADAHVPKADARALYDDRTPPPTPEELEMRRMERQFRAVSAATGRPARDDRRARRRLAGKE